LHFRMTKRLPSLTFNTNLWVLGTYFSTNFDLVGFSMSKSIALSVNYCHERASTCVFFDLNAPTGRLSTSL
jgi:hypothetical protein